jgi:hypothetical protein
VITIVSGLPRSGTSMMMQMLAAGGMPILTDNKRQPDIDNPRGYFEWEKITRLCAEPEIIAQAEGKAVKVISRVLGCLPAGHDYKVIFMRRPFAEVAQSQHEMLVHRYGIMESMDAPRVEYSLETHIWQVIDWSTTQRHMRFWFVNYRAVTENPETEAGFINTFVGFDLNVPAMAAAVDPSLYRHRAK